MRTLDPLRFTILAFSFLFVSHLASAEELPINSQTSGLQTLPSIAVDDDGFVVAWQGRDQEGGAGIRARLYGLDGVPKTGELLVNETPTGQEMAPDVALRSDGSFVVVWQSSVSSGSSYDIRARIFSASGQPLGGERQLNAWTEGQQINPRVATGPEDGFVVTWRSNGSFGDDVGSGSIQLRRFDSAGEPLDQREFQVNTTAERDQTRPDVAVGSDGRALVVWESLLQDGSGTAIVASWFGADGDPDTGEIMVNQTSSDFQTSPAVAMVGPGEAVVAWTSDGQDGSLGGIWQRRLSASGPSGTEEQVNTFTESDQFNPSVGALEDGGWVVSWSSDGSYGTDDLYLSVQSRRYSASGVAEGPEQQVNATTPNNQWRSAVAAAGEDFVVAWASGEQDGDDEGVFARVYRGPTLFSDGFESGDPRRWSP